LNRIHLFIDFPGEDSLDTVASALAATLGMPSLSVRESSNYLEGRYFHGKHQDLDIEVSLCDPVFSTLRYRLQIRSAAADSGQQVDEIVRRQLMPVGFICKRVQNLGRVDQQVLDYPKQS
jgi:hypothetical protein